MAFDVELPTQLGQGSNDSDMAQDHLCPDEAGTRLTVRWVRAFVHIAWTMLGHRDHHVLTRRLFFSSPPAASYPAEEHGRCPDKQRCPIATVNIKTNETFTSETLFHVSGVRSCSCPTRGLSFSNMCFFCSGVESAPCPTSSPSRPSVLKALLACILETLACFPSTTDPLKNILSSRKRETISLSRCGPHPLCPTTTMHRQGRPQEQKQQQQTPDRPAGRSNSFIEPSSSCTIPLPAAGDTTHPTASKPPWDE